MHRFHQTTPRRPRFGRLAARLALAAGCALSIACGPGPVGDIVPRPDPTPGAVERPGGDETPRPGGTRKSPKPTRTPTPAPGSKGGGSGGSGGGTSGPRESGGEARRSPRLGDGPGSRATPTPAREGRPNGGAGHEAGRGSGGANKPESKSGEAGPADARPADGKGSAEASGDAKPAEKPANEVPPPASEPAPASSETPAAEAPASPAAAESAAESPSPAPAEAGPSPTPAPGDSARATPFTEQELERYLAAAAGLREKGLDRPGGPAGDDVARFRQEWSAVLSAHGFDDATYRRLNESVAWAFQASELAGEAGLEATAAAAVEDRLSAMAGRIPDERLARLREGMIAAERDKFRQYASVPEPNLALARRFRDRLAPILGK